MVSSTTKRLYEFDRYLNLMGNCMAERMREWGDQLLFANVQMIKMTGNVNEMEEGIYLVVSV